MSAKSRERSLIVNADDFGLTSGINRGIIEAHERGIVTSASLMVRGAAASEAAQLAHQHGRLSVGLHLDFAEWRYAAEEWHAYYTVVDLSDAHQVRLECARQLAEFQSLLGREPTHLDSHQHQHLSEPVRTIVCEIGADLSVPVRSCSDRISYSGSFYGQTGEGQPYPDGIFERTLISVIENLPAGWTELGCHPGYSDGLDSVYLLEREDELRVLCSETVRETLRRCKVRLRSFSEIPDRRRASTRD